MPQADLVLLHAPSVYDFRKKSILYGPVSDLVPSTPVFEMYPIGLTTIAEYLERHGLRVRIVNLAVRMLNSERFDPEKLIRKLRPTAFGIDLHWMPHAHGAIEVARLCKKYHPDVPVIFGGFSATYYH
ncbi:MAG: cobalamin-dependent protein, partial [Anaerolineae bacterium]